MSFATIRTEIKTILEDVTGIGRVHDFIRHTTFWSEFSKRHTDLQIINDWEITRIGLTQNLAAVQTQIAAEPTFDDIHTVQIIGRMGLQDNSESEKKFQTLVDAVITALRKSADLSQTVVKPIHPIDAIIDHDNFHGNLVHQVNITFNAQERTGG